VFGVTPTIGMRSSSRSARCHAPPLAQAEIADE